MSTGPDYIAAVQADSDRIVAALAANREGAIPWSDTWTVQDCARHVGGLHHVMAHVIEGRPTANFSLFKTLEQPAASDPALGPWIAGGTAAVVGQLKRTAPDEPCWSWWPEDQTVGFWARRVSLETLVHRWDVECGAGVDIAPADPRLAADAIDEFLDIFVGLQRVLHTSPGAGESVHVHCTDTDGEWFVEFPAPGERVLRREHAKGDVAFRGSAEGLLLYLWGRLPADAAGVDIVGDPAVVARWPELAPSI
ncbi:MAG TPA: maleylpyruvate isomerase family mycothiol-dependent enzyme [Acidimicrobiia bacterium]